MGLLCVTENDVIIGIEGGTIYTEQKKERTKIPKKSVTGISIFGTAQITTQCIRYCLENGVNVSYFGGNGYYYGSLRSTSAQNARRMKKQLCLSSSDDFSVLIAQKIITAKIGNQIIVAKRYAKKDGPEYVQALFQMKNAKKCVERSSSVEQILGYEGVASRNYFSILANAVEEEFRFQGRNRRPPKDPFNAMISFGYAVLTNEITGEIENRGLSAYAGFLHEDYPGNPALANDLIEEWRPVIVDSVVMSLINGHEIGIDEFEYKDGGCILAKSARSKLIEKMEKKMYTRTNYLSYVEKELDFRSAIWHQVEQMAKAIEHEDAAIYRPVRIR